MTPQELKNLIESDPQAKALAESGAADVCANRCMEIAPKITQQTLLNELSIMRLYSDPMVAEGILQQIENVAKANPVVARVAKWMLPGAPGIDFGDGRVRVMLTTPIQQGGLGLTVEQARPILVAAEVAPHISGADVSTAWPFGDNK